MADALKGAAAPILPTGAAARPVTVAQRYYCSHCGHSDDYAGTGPHACPGCGVTLQAVEPGDLAPEVCKALALLSPADVLRQLDHWMGAAKMASDHPWRKFIKGTLPNVEAVAAAPLPTVTAEPLRPAQDCGDRVRFELHPVLAGLSLLTNSVRVLRAVSDHASLSESFADALTEACSTWFDPFVHSGEASAEAVVSDLARYAADLCAEILVMDLNGGAA